MLVVMALYGLKSYGPAFRDLLTEHFHALGYRSSISDSGVWMLPAVKPGVIMYYGYVI